VRRIQLHPKVQRDSTVVAEAEVLEAEIAKVVVEDVVLSINTARLAKLIPTRSFINRGAAMMGMPS